MSTKHLYFFLNLTLENVKILAKYADFLLQKYNVVLKGFGKYNTSFFSYEPIGEGGRNVVCNWGTCSNNSYFRSFLFSAFDGLFHNLLISRNQGSSFLYLLPGLGKIRYHDSYDINQLVYSVPPRSC